MFAKASNAVRRVVIGGLVLVGLSDAAIAESAGSANFAFDNPFALTLDPGLFAPTEELRFEKAERVFVDSMSGVGQELFDIASFPLREPLTFGAYALGIAALTLVDKQTTTAYQQTFVPIGNKINPPELFDTSWSPVAISVDEQYLAATVAGSYAFGLVANDERAQVAALLSAKAFAYSYLTSHLVLKTAFGRHRPVPDLANHKGPTGDFTKNPFSFFNGDGLNFGSRTSSTGMPSFHFTMYFSTARIYSGVYDNYLVPYGLAAALALQSAEGHNHWVSDMAAGALIGTGIGNVLLNSYENRRSESYGVFTPVVSSQGAGFNYQVTF